MQGSETSPYSPLPYVQQVCIEDGPPLSYVYLLLLYVYIYVCVCVCVTSHPSSRCALSHFSTGLHRTPTAWIANCVGFHNQVYFMRFLVYLFIGTLFMLATGGPLMMWPPEEDRLLWREHKMGLTMAVIICGSASIPVGFMVLLHGWLLFTNQTTIEMYDNRDKRHKKRAKGELFVNPYDIGRWKNFHQVFGVGRFWFSWLLPGARPLGDGTSFPTLHSSMSDITSPNSGDHLV